MTLTDGCVNILAAFPYRVGFTPTACCSTYIALRWSAATNNVNFYRHIALLEQRGLFTDKGNLRHIAPLEQRGLFTDKGNLFTPEA